MLKISNVKKNYPKFSLDCSLEVKHGCITGLIGQNGAGKSTTFKAALGLIKIEDGEIQIGGKDVSTLTNTQKQKIGVVLSDSGFSAYLRIKDIVPVLVSLYQEFDENLFISRCEQFQLPMDKQIKEFSTGMKAKLKVLVAISHKAELLILDEPTAGLDVVAREDVLELLREYMEQDEQRAILISSHISSDLEGLCDDIYMIHQGKIVLHEETDVLLDKYALLQVNEQQYEKLDKQYLLRTKKEAYGYRCLTNERQFYVENYPEIVIEKGNIDDLIMMVIKGEQ